MKSSTPKLIAATFLGQTRENRHISGSGIENDTWNSRLITYLSQRSVRWDYRRDGDSSDAILVRGYVIRVVGSRTTRIARTPMSVTIRRPDRNKLRTGK